MTTNQVRTRNECECEDGFLLSCWARVNTTLTPTHHSSSRRYYCRQGVVAALLETHWALCLLLCTVSYTSCTSNSTCIRKWHNDYCSTVASTKETTAPRPCAHNYRKWWLVSRERDDAVGRVSSKNVDKHSILKLLQPFQKTCQPRCACGNWPRQACRDCRMETHADNK